MTLNEVRLQMLGPGCRDWRLLPVKAVFRRMTDASAEAGQVPVLSLTQRGLIVRDLSSNEGQIAASYDGYTCVAPGDIALNPMDLVSGAVACAAQVGLVSPAYKVLRPIRQENVCVEYFQYLLRFYYEGRVFLPFGKGVGRSETGGGRWTLGTEELMNFPIWVPPLIEQQRIAAFLDAKTAEIDALISELTGFAETLRTRDKSLVAECVTKGIPARRAGRAMKDSGVEWIGEVPEDWCVQQLRRSTVCLDSLRRPVNAEERASISGPYPYWGANSIQDYVNDFLVDEEVVLLGEDGAPFFDPIKPVAFVSHGKIWPNNHIHVLRTTGNASYLRHSLNTVDYRPWVGGSTRDKLTQGSMMAIPLPTPSFVEQQEIADYLDAELAKSAELLAEVENQVALLKTYRKALISEAVTGRLEV